jgi:lactoylglutathione lyase
MVDPSALGPVNGVLIWTSGERYDALAVFYRDVLALPVRTDRAGHLAVEWSNGMRLTVGTHSAVTGAAVEPERVMVNLQVADIHAAADRLRARGVVFVRPPSPEPWGGWIATFADPDGNLLQLLQPAP